MSRAPTACFRTWERSWQVAPTVPSARHRKWAVTTTVPRGSLTCSPPTPRWDWLSPNPNSIRSLGRPPRNLECRIQGVSTTSDATCQDPQQIDSRADCFRRNAASNAAKCGVRALNYLKLFSVKQTNPAADDRSAGFCFLRLSGRYAWAERALYFFISRLLRRAALFPWMIPLPATRSSALRASPTAVDAAF